MARTRVFLAGLAASLVAACATAPPAPPPAPTVSIARLYEQPAERAFLNAMRLYEDGQHERSEAMFRRALAEGLADGHDVAMANKHLAFIACAYNRPAECEAGFRAAFAADPGFRLTDAEVGHPIWGPVYRRVAAEEAARRRPAQ
ncbi:MAG: TssQ family T6SS-associated lipoprotein [Betaproteobacteria bacterium]